MTHFFSRTQRKISESEGRFPYERIATRNIFPATHIITTVDANIKSTVASISQREGIWIEIRRTMIDGVSTGIYDNTFTKREFGFCITSIINANGTTKSILIYAVICCASCSVETVDPAIMKMPTYIKYPSMK